MRVQQAHTGYTHIHEMAHNMGAHHHKEQLYQPGPGLYSYSAGWRWTSEDMGRYCSVMTYESGAYFLDGRTHTRVPYFSNPSLSYLGAATGDAVDGDNARTLVSTKTAIAAYRSRLGEPDFSITEMTLTPTSPKAGGTFTASVTVKNQGRDSGSGGYLSVWSNRSGAATCDLSGNKRQTVGTLAAGASKTLTFTGLSAGTAGTKTFRAYVDSACGTAESNESNNQSTMSYTVN